MIMIGKTPLLNAFNSDKDFAKAFSKLTYFKQKEFVE
jgi:hypothetical protein